MKRIIHYVLLFLSVIAMMSFLLSVIAIIPKDSIQRKSEESAEILMRKPSHFYNYVGGGLGIDQYHVGDCSKVDQIADCILLSIAYYIDPNHPLESSLWAYYYDGREDIKNPLNSMNASYARTVKEETNANKQYLRYWHGSLIIVRPLLTVWNVRQIKTCIGIVIAGLLLVLSIQLLRNKLFVEMISMTISMIAVSVWYVPLSLEYTWTFVLMLIAAKISVRLSLDGKTKSLYTLFFLTGMMTAFFDFLTTETLTLLIPLLLAIRITSKREEGSDWAWKMAIRSGFLWIVGYFGTWVSKWVISTIVLREDITQYIQWGRWQQNEMIISRSPFQVIVEGFARNIVQLFPFGYGSWGGILFFLFVAVFLFVPVGMNRIRLRKQIDRRILSLYVLIGSLVFIRFLALSQHAWFHYFFTYRALASSVLALCFIIMELVEIKARKAQRTTITWR